MVMEPRLRWLDRADLVVGGRTLVVEACLVRLLD